MVWVSEHVQKRRVQTRSPTQLGIRELFPNELQVDAEIDSAKKRVTKKEGSWNPFCSV